MIKQLLLDAEVLKELILNMSKCEIDEIGYNNLCNGLKKMN